MRASSRYRNAARISENGFESPENVYVMARIRQWLARMSALGCPLDKSFFDCFFASTGNTYDSLAQLLAEAAQREHLEQYAEIEKRIDRLLTDWNVMGFWCMGNSSGLEPLMRKIVAEYATKISPSRQGTVFASARRQLRTLLGLRDVALTLAEYVFINQAFPLVQTFFEEKCRVWEFEGRHLLARMLECDVDELNRAFVALDAARLAIWRGRNIRLNDGFAALWHKGAEAKKQFCLPLRGRTIPLENFRLRPEETAHALALLKSASDRPVHILLYGPTGTGKTSFARSLAKACGGKAWAVASRIEDDDDDRRASLVSCLYISSRNPGSIVVADEAERLLDTDIRPGFSNKDKAWLNELLEKPGSMVIWISNQVKHLDPAVLRRFSLSLHFDSLGPRERLALWRQIAADQRVAAYLPESTLEKLARDHDAPAAVITEAICQAKALYRSTKEFPLAVERVMRSHATLRNHGRLPLPKARAVPDFSLEGVTLEGPQGSAEALLEACRRAATLLDSPAGIAPGAATMLFYGPPGTGKTALARYIAKELGRECLVKRADDLLGPFVGMTEQSIAQAFTAAATQGTVLIIDEVDSFLSERAVLDHNWERTMVNTFLTSLEECRGFCICTTNARERLDAAAMRRFVHKIAFGYASRKQAAALYEALLAPLAGGPLSPEGERELSRLDRLTPGDFQVVRASRQSLFTSTGGVTHGELVAALRREMELKLEKRGRVMGFSPQRAENLQ